MDSMVPWITLVLLLLIDLPQHLCDTTASVTCDGAIPQNGITYSITYSSCSSSDDLSWEMQNNTITIKHEAPVTIMFKLNTIGELESSYIRKANESQDCSIEGTPTYMQKEDEYQSGSVEFNGNSILRYEPPDNSGSGCFSLITIKFEVVDSEVGDSGAGANRVAVALGVAAGVLAIVLVAVVVVMRRRLPWHKLTPVNSRNSKDSDFASVNDLSDLEVGAPRHYSYKELSSATHSFDSKYVVGEGGFGTVYKGVLKDSRSPVAIKRLSQYARQGAREFLAEVKIISQLRHRNLVQLLGWCLEKEELILVYEYMPNGDLDDLIYADKPKCDLYWKQRFNVLRGVATALVYLHEEWVQRVVHRDVKTSNVMLDSNLNARLGDFGLARLSAHSQAPQSTLVAGTLGYLAPEFSMSGKATDKTDVYAFGVVALEVACARRPLSPDLILVDWVWDLHKQDKLLDAVDPKLNHKLGSTDDEVQMRIVLQVGLLCAHPDPNARPSMRQVLNMLTGEASVPRVPRSKPVPSYFEDD